MVKSENIGNLKNIKIWEELKLASDNCVEVKFKAVPENEGYARVLSAAFAAQLNPIVEEIEDIKTAVSEAVTNSIIHGYEYGYNTKLAVANYVQMELLLCGNVFYIKIQDYGVGIEDIGKAMEPLYTSKPDMERSGMGFAFMEAFMDELYVESTPGHGTCVYMSKKICGE